MIHAIFFDFNGVIINDEPLQMAAYKDALREHSIELSESDYYAALGMDDKTFVQVAFERGKKELTDDVLKNVIEGKTLRHRQLIADELPLFPGVVTFLKAARREYSLGIVSMALLADIEYALDRAHLSNLFSVVVSAEDVKVCKPAPDCYRIALEKLNNRREAERLPPLSPGDCLVIEDAPPGIESGRQAGMRTLGVTNTVPEEQLRAAGAEVVTASLSDWTVDAVRHVFGE
ncbi:MAG TPA: HAD family phosphatase [Pyrinomonadaceae bacterium]|nr:HAD family phosphatase [Pyrinomonadaceae bacterium]